MDFNNNNPHAPQGGQQNVPDQRLEQLAERLRQMELQNSQLRGQIDNMTQASQPNQQRPQKQYKFQPEVQSELEQFMQDRFQEQFSQYDAQVKNHIGYLADQNDELKFQMKYGQSERYKNLLPKVEAMRKEYQARNQWIPREEALKIAFFEEEGRKLPQTPQAPATPVFDPYFQTHVDPQTGKPIAQAQQAPQMDQFGGFESQQNFGQPQMQQVPQQQPHAGMAWQQQQQAPQYQQQPQNMNQGYGNQVPGVQSRQNNPYGNAYGQAPQLPNQGLNSPAYNAGNMNNPNAGRNLDINSSDADLAAFEEKFGDVSF